MVGWVQKSQENGQETTTYSEKETVSNKQHTLIYLACKNSKKQVKSMPTQVCSADLFFLKFWLNQNGNYECNVVTLRLGGVFCNKLKLTKNKMQVSTCKLCQLAQNFVFAYSEWTNQIELSELSQMTPRCDFKLRCHEIVKQFFPIHWLSLVVTS